MEIEDSQPDICALRKLYKLLQKTEESLQNKSSFDKDDQQHAKQTLLEIISELFKPNTSSAELSSNMKQLNLARETKFSHEKARAQENNGFETCSEIKEKAHQSVKSHLKPSQKTQRNLSGESVFRSASFQKQEDGFNLSDQIEVNDYVSEEVANAIKGIESGTSDLQLCSDFVKKNEAHHDMANVVNAPIQTRECLVTKSGLSKVDDFVAERNVFLNRQPTQRTRAVKDLSQANWMVSCSPELTPVERNVLRGQIASQKVRETSQSSKNDQLSRLAGQRTNQVLGRKVIKTTIDRLESKTSNYVHGLRIPSSLDDETEEPPMSANMANQIIKKSHVHNPMVPRDGTRNLARPKPKMAEVSSAHKLSGTRTRKTIKRQSRRQIVRPTLFVREQESTETNSSNSHYLQSSTSSWIESKVYSSPEHRLQTSRRNTRRLAQESSSEKSSSSSYPYSVETKSEYSGDVSSNKADRPKRVENRERGMGTLRRWKNKLGLIFHHHHHHHHHHHNHGTQQSKKHDPTKTKERALGRKGVGNNVVVKNEMGHFHALIEGLMRHVGKSKNKKKKQEALKGGIGRMVKKKKKADWSKMFRRLKVGNNKRKHVKLK